MYTGQANKTSGTVLIRTRVHIQIRAPSQTYRSMAPSRPEQTTVAMHTMLYIKLQMQIQNQVKLHHALSMASLWPKTTLHMTGT